MKFSKGCQQKSVMFGKNNLVLTKKEWQIFKRPTQIYFIQINNFLSRETL